jgi:hypothetical protein
MSKPRRNLVFVRSRLNPCVTELAMEPTATAQYPLNSSDDWLRKRQGLALPVLPPNDT